MTDREDLERQAVEAVCAAHYYDLMDCLNEATDGELQAIVQGTACPACGL